MFTGATVRRDPPKWNPAVLVEEEEGDILVKTHEPSLSLSLSPGLCLHTENENCVVLYETRKSST